MKLLINLILVLCCVSAQAASVRNYLRNPFTNEIDTNALIVTKISTNILADGGVIAVGRPQRFPFSPYTNTLAIGFYSVSNINLRSAYVINVDDASSTLYDCTNLLHSGFNTYVVVQPTFSRITNALGYLPATNGSSGGVNVTGAQLAATTTNAGVVTVSVPTNSVVSVIQQQFAAGSNTFSGTATLSGFTASGNLNMNINGGTVTAGANTMSPSGFSTAGGILNPTGFAGNGYGMTNIPYAGLSDSARASITNAGVSAAQVAAIMATNNSYSASNLAVSIRHYTNGAGSQIANESNFVSYINGHAYGSAAYLTNTPGNGYIWKQLPVPPRIISSFPSGACSVDEAWITNKIREISTNGMLAGGWDIIALEDGQYNSNRVGGLLEFDTTKFPKGPEWLNRHAETNGVKLWSYLSHSALACCPEGNPGSPAQYLASDISQNMGWGFRGLIIDECIPDQNVLTAERLKFVGRVFNEVANNYYALNTNTVANNRRGMALLATSVKNPGGSTWPNDGNQWEAVPAESMYNMNIIAVPWYFGPSLTFTNWLNLVKMMEAYNWAVGPGHYTGPTSFVPQNLTDAQLTYVMNFYTMMCAPMQIGNHTPNTFFRLQNQEMRMIHQHPDVIPGRTVSSNITTEVMARPIGAGTNFVLLINKSNNNAVVTFDPTWVGLRKDQRYVVRDPWYHYDLLTTNGVYQRTVVASNAEAITIRVLPDIVAENDLSTNGLTAWLSLWNRGYTNGEIVNYVADRVTPSTIWQPFSTFAPLTTTNAGFGFYKPYGASTTANLRNGTFALTQPFHVFAVFKTPTNQAAGNIFDGTNSSSRSQAFTLSGSLYLNAGSQISAVIGTNGNTIVAEFYLNGGSSYIRTNGVLAVSGNPGANDLRGINVGSDYTGFQETSAAKTEIGDVLVASGTLTSAQITSITNHLMRKFGVIEAQSWTVPDSTYAGTFSGTITGNGAGLTNVAPRYFTYGFINTTINGTAIHFHPSSGAANATFNVVAARVPVDTIISDINVRLTYVSHVDTNYFLLFTNGVYTGRSVEVSVSSAANSANSTTSTNVGNTFIPAGTLWALQVTNKSASSRQIYGDWAIRYFAQ